MYFTPRSVRCSPGSSVPTMVPRRYHLVEPRNPSPQGPQKHTRSMQTPVLRGPPEKTVVSPSRFVWLEACPSGYSHHKLSGRLLGETELPGPRACGALGVAALQKLSLHWLQACGKHEEAPPAPPGNSCQIRGLHPPTETLSTLGARALWHTAGTAWRGCPPWKRNKK